MENCKEKLNYLLDLKKTNKEPNKIERDQFSCAWENLVVEEDYSDDAEYYLYNGFTYCGATPLYRFIRNSEDPLTKLDKFFSGKLYGTNCASTVPILFHLFTLMLNEKNRNMVLISEVIRRVPSALKNKEGKKYGQAGRSLKKYVLDELRVCEMPDFREMIESGLTYVCVKDFIENLDEIIEGLPYDGYSQKCQKNIEVLRTWMHPIATEPESKEKKIEETREVICEEKKYGDENDEDAEKKDHLDNESNTLPDKNGSEDYGKQEDLNRKDEIGRLQNIIKLLNSQISDIRQQLLFAESQLKTKEKNINILTQQLCEKEGVLSRVATELADAIKVKEETEKKMEIVQSELSQRLKMEDILTRDQEKQSDEMLNRLASKLKIEYRDFKDAIDLPMDNDLGENMREQLKNVFDILIKAGLAIK